MKLQIQLREEDLREANANAYAKKGRLERGKIRLGPIQWVVIFLLATAIFVLLNRNTSGPIKGPQQPEPLYDLALAVLPSAVAATWFLAFLSIALIVQVQIARGREA